MNPGLLGLLVFVCVFGAGWLATRLRARLPAHHLGSETKETVKLAMGLVATMTALILGLLVASAKSTYDAQKAGVVAVCARMILLDRLLTHYGPEAAPARQLLQKGVAEMSSRLWPSGLDEPVQLDPSNVTGDAIYDAIEALKPADDRQRQLKSDSLRTATEIGQMRWLLFEQSGSSISTPLLAVVIWWLAVLFVSFGLFAPPNHTALGAILVSALSVSGAIFLIMELDRPFDGLIHIPDDAMQRAGTHIGK